MIILGIETSCDETAAAVLTCGNGRIQILSNVVASSAKLQEKFGGIIPEQAAREQIRSIIPVIDAAISNSKCPISNIDAIAVTYGPGLVGSLLVGVETAKTLSIVWNKPLIPVNHLLGHFYANWIQNGLSNIGYRISEKQEISTDKRLTINDIPQFPCLGLLASGGHTDLVLFTGHNKYKYLGGTRDDAAGECFDKCARLLGLPYPGGPFIAQKAMEFKIKSFGFAQDKNSKFKIELPRPLINEKTFDFSFSGLKTALLREVERLKAIKQFNNLTIQKLSFEVQQAIVDVLVEKTIRAAQEFHVEQIILAGGVTANEELIRALKFEIRNLKLENSLHVPPPNLCTDNAAMIASAAFFLKPSKNPLSLQANPNLSLAY